MKKMVVMPDGIFEAYRIISVTPKENFKDEKTGIEFLKGNQVQGYLIKEKPNVVAFPEGTISAVLCLNVPVERFEERVDLLYLTDAEILEKLKPKTIIEEEPNA